MFKNIYVFIVLFVAIFGPKFGFLDTRLILSFLIYLNNFKDLKIFPKSIVFILGCLFFLVLYSFVIYIFNDSDYIDSLRYLRCIFGILLLVHLYKHFDFYLLFKHLIFILFLHVLSIYLSVIFPFTQVFFAKISGYDKEFRPFRVSGLTAGFDISGILPLIFSYLLFELTKVRKSKLLFLIFFLTYFSIFFTSRTNALYAIFLAFYFFVDFIKKVKFKFNFIFPILLFSGFFIFIIYSFVLPILIDSWNLDIAIELADRPDIYESGYSKNDPLSILESFLIFPDSFLGLFFGTSYDPPESDSGYIKVINIVGVLGLLFYIYTFLSTIYLSYPRKYQLTDSIILLKKVLFFIVFVTFVASIKNQYLFTRGIFELFIISILLLKMQFNLQTESQSES